MWTELELILMCNIMAEGFRFMPFGLVRPRTFRLSAWVTLTQVFTCAGGTDVSLRDFTIAQMGNGATECGWRHALEEHGGFGGFWKSQLVELSLAVRRRRLTFACSPRLGQLPHGMGGRWKSQNRKNVYLSPYSEEPLNSKVIKSFVP